MKRQVYRKTGVTLEEFETPIEKLAKDATAAADLASLKKAVTDYAKT